MYFLLFGSVIVMEPRTGRVKTTLEAPGYFGEMALQGGSAHAKRNSDVIALTRYWL